MYEIIDEVLVPWCEANDVKLFTEDRDWEIRSFQYQDYKFLFVAIKRGFEYKKFKNNTVVEEKTIYDDEIKLFLRKLLIKTMTE